MRDTTSVGESHRQVDGPAAVFSEKGLSMFLDFVAAIVTGRDSGTDISGESPKQVNDFLASWERHKAAGEAREGADDETHMTDDENATDGKGKRRNYHAEIKALESIMKGNGMMDMRDIVAGMQDEGFWQVVNPRTSMKRLLDRFPGRVVDTRRGTYHWPANGEIVLKFRPPCPVCNGMKCPDCNNTGFEQPVRGERQHEEQQE